MLLTEYYDVSRPNLQVDDPFLDPTINPDLDLCWSMTFPVLCQGIGVWVTTNCFWKIVLGQLPVRPPGSWAP